MNPLPLEFYQRNPAQVAVDLLGKILIRRSRAGFSSGRIVEVEAYLFQNDPACHATRGRTKSNQTMFGPAGRAYVYPIHSRYCLNAVTEGRNVGSAVLIRGVEPLTGIELMRQRRQRQKPRELTRGPGRLCDALAIDRRLDSWNLTIRRRLWITVDATSELDASQVRTSPRIGISSGQELPLRFFVDGNPFVSGSRNHGRKKLSRTNNSIP